MSFPVASSSTATRSFMSRFFSWSSRKSDASAASSGSFDLEAQKCAIVPDVTIPALARTSAAVHLPGPAESDFDPEDDCTDAFDDFFGVTYSREERRARRLAAQAQAGPATHASRHDAPAVPPTATGVPPPYKSSDGDSDCATIVPSLPSYEETIPTSPAPYTIPEALFRYGFILPLLWPLGACFLFNFHSPSELVAWYTPEESAARVRAFRAVELKWARRCLLATVVLTFLVLLVVGATYGLMMWMKN